MKTQLFTILAVVFAMKSEAQNTYINELVSNNSIFGQPNGSKTVTEITENLCGDVFSISYYKYRLKSTYDDLASIIKHSSDGNSQINGSLYKSDFSFPSKCILGSNQKLYVCGGQKRQHFPPGSTVIPYGNFMIKCLNPSDLSQNWTKEFTFNYNGVERNGFAYDLIESFNSNGTSNGFIACGSIADNNTEGGHILDPAVVKFDANGNQIWGYRLDVSQMTGQVNFHVLEKIVQTSDGGYILAGIADKDFSLTTNFNLHIISQSLRTHFLHFGIKYYQEHKENALLYFSQSALEVDRCSSHQGVDNVSSCSFQIVSS